MNEPSTQGSLLEEGECVCLSEHFLGSWPALTPFGAEGSSKLVTWLPPVPQAVVIIKGKIFPRSLDEF